MAAPAPEPLQETTATQTITIHTVIPDGTPLQLEIPAPVGPPTPSYATITLPPTPPGLPLPLTTTVSVVVLTDAVFMVTDPIDGEMEQFTLHQTVPNLPVSTVVMMSHPPIGGLSLSADDSTATLILASAPPMGFASSLDSTTLDATLATITGPTSFGAASTDTLGLFLNNTATITTLVQPTESQFPSAANNHTNATDKAAASSALTPLQKGEIALYVLLGLVVIAACAIIAWRLKKYRKAEAGWRVNEYRKRIQEQQRRADETAWNAKVVKEGVELTAEQFRERVQAALHAMEGYQQNNRLRAKASQERVAKGSAGGLDDC